jgi:thioredoxin-dependent peroxiredoxin
MWHAIQLQARNGLLFFLLLSAATYGQEACAQETDGQAQGPQVGDLAPEFTCLDDEGELWKSRDHIGKQILVLQFYPSDFSFNCTRQAQRYRDCQEVLARQNAKVVGISGDAVLAHRLFKEAHSLNFTLLADSAGDVARQFGVPLRAGGKAMARAADGGAIIDVAGRPLQIPRTFTAPRWTFIIDLDGRVIHRETESCGTREVLEFLAKLSEK